MTKKTIEVFYCESTGKEFLKEKDYMSHMKDLKKKEELEKAESQKEAKIKKLINKSETVQEFLDGICEIGNDLHILKDNKGKPVKLRIFAQNPTVHVDREGKPTIQFGWISVAERDHSGFSSDLHESVLGWTRGREYLHSGSGGYRGKSYTHTDGVTYTGYLCEYSGELKQLLPKMKKNWDVLQALIKNKAEFENELQLKSQEEIDADLHCSVWNSENLELTKEMDALQHELNVLQAKRNEITKQYRSRSFDIINRIHLENPFLEEELLHRMQSSLPGLK